MTQQQSAESDFASFWQFSLTFYQQSGVKSVCLRLQDEQAMNVNILLFLLWFSYTQKKLLAQEKLLELFETVKGYQEQVDKFREFRRDFIDQLRVTDTVNEKNATYAIRDALLNAELLLEKEMQQAIIQWFHQPLMHEPSTNHPAGQQSCKPVNDISDIELEFIATENLERYGNHVLVKMTNAKKTNSIDTSDKKQADTHLLSRDVSQLLQQMSQALLQFSHQLH